MTKGMTYAESGVDIEKGNQFTDFIKHLSSNAVSKGIGGFASAWEIDTKRYKNPMIMSSTDGVGTKLLVAQALGIYNTVGIDLVAMCVNDLVVCGAEPVSFLDYIACNAIDTSVLGPIVEGIVEGCSQAGCVLSGGETAELPDMYSAGDFDLAGFAIGVAEKAQLLPKPKLMCEGDILLGLPSSGIHSNGLSLARKIITDRTPELFKELLVPTRIYAKELKQLISTKKILGAAHITGGGLIENTQRILPEGLVPKFSFSWPEPTIFSEIRERGKIAADEMVRVFNLGIGVVLTIHKEDIDEVKSFALQQDIEIVEIGSIARG